MDILPPDHRSLLIERILETTFSEDYELSKEDLVVQEIAVLLDHFARTDQYSRRLSDIRKRKSFKRLLDNAEEVSSLLSELVMLPSVGPVLAGAFVEAQSDDSPHAELTPELEHAYNFRVPTSTIDSLEYPKLHILELTHSLNRAVEAMKLVARPSYPNKRGAPEKDTTWLIKHLKVALTHYCEEIQANTMAGIIRELLILIDISVSSKTIENDLSSQK